MIVIMPKQQNNIRYPINRLTNYIVKYGAGGVEAFKEITVANENVPMRMSELEKLRAGS